MAPIASPSSSSTPFISHSVRHDASTGHHQTTPPHHRQGATPSLPNDGAHHDDGLQVLSTRGAATTARSLLKQEILSEEEYITHLSHIIKRDFFPSLATLDAQHEILDAFESDDPRKVEESVRRMRMLWTPTPGTSAAGGCKGKKRATPMTSTPYDDSTPTYFGQTPLSTPSSSTKPKRRTSPPRPRIDPSISLDAFQSRYTSEDNSSFAVLLARDNAARKQKYAWAWEAENKAKALAIRGREARERLVDVTRELIEGSEDGTVRMLDGAAGRPGERKLIVGKAIKVGRDDRLMIASSGTSTSSNQQLMIQDTQEARPRVGELELVKRGSHKLAPQRPDLKDQGRQYVDYDRATVEEDEANRAPTIDEVQPRMESWDFKNRNSFMFPPDADTSGPSDPSTIEKGKQRVVKAGEERAVNYGATRLTTLERARVGEDGGNDATSESSGPSRSRIGAAIAGTPYHANPSRTPKVSGFPFVDALPSPQAASLPPQALQELMTWGTIEATPVTLRSSTEYDGSVGPFRIQEGSRREGLAHRMAKQAKRSLSDRVDAVSKKGRRQEGLGFLGGGVGSILSASTSSSSRMTAPHTPRSNSILALSPAAASILHRTKQGRSIGKGMTRPMTSSALSTSTTTTTSKGDATVDRLLKKRMKAKIEARELQSRKRLERERWSASPAPVAAVAVAAPGSGLGSETQEELEEASE
ncbi:BQ2448_3462 [Microbotryum intermedium]|uniref:BQ2448_3462 protein n=1 Tax=Microbotryum intermedium TaxID=269621 RepID=A0A238FA32_9BASI|nr:BQ2448_3462 [Microbotryum intermedium]